MQGLLVFCGAVVLSALLFSGGAHGYSIVGTMGHKGADHYALLTVPRGDLTLLMDTEHKYLTVKEALNNTCYLVALETAPRTALRLIVHIYHRGLRGLLWDLRVAGAVTQGWMSSTLGTEHARFCQHSPKLLLRSLTAEPTRETEKMDEHAGAIDPLVG